MKKFMLMLCLCAATPALAASSISFTFTSPAGSLTKTYNLSDTDAARFVKAMKAVYSDPVATGTNPDGTPITRAATTAEVLGRMMDGVKNGWLNVVQSQESVAASAAATAGVTVIPTN